LKKENHTDEQDLIRNLKKGSYGAFNAIYRLYAKRLFAYCLSFTKSPEEAEEIVQDVFVKLWVNRAAIRQDETLKSLFFIMARHQLINAYRSGLNRPVCDAFGGCEETAAAADVHQGLEYEEFVGEVLEALKKLPPTQQKVVSLSRMEDLSNGEIARMLSLSEQTVKNQLSLGLKKLKEMLKGSVLLWFVW
jgi:RNA polymerase sigma-70 factor (ECF subfamily)